jgi:hypothetical protein
VKLTDQEQVIQMRRVLFRSLLVLTTILPLGTAAAVPAMAQPAVTAQFGPSATLIARGVAVQVGVVYTCPAGSDASSFSISTSINERVSGGRIAQGTGGANNTTGTGVIVCDETTHTLPITVLAATGIAFRKGTALANGFFQLCGASPSCTNVNFSAIIRIKR